jgi:hypothetical protein
MATLFEISDEQRRLNAMLEEAEGELTPELEAALEVNQYNLEAKAEDYRNAIMMNAKDIEAAKEEKKRLDAFIKRKENANDTMKQRLKDAMLLFDTPKIQINGGVGGTLSFRRSEQVVIDDENAVPEAFRKVTWTLDKTAIKEAIKQGEDIEGATIVENMNLQIK